MLSVGRREDGRKGLGFRGGGMEEDNELEEGEACSGPEDDSCIDPDALSYIDEKIQDVLGHFQKDFEAGVSAENLGAKFGGYGSFLPTYQRSPFISCQPRSPQKVPNQNVAKSPFNPSVEVTNPNPSVTTSSSYSKNNSVTVPPLDNSFKRDVCTNKPNIQEPSSLHTSFNKPTNGTDNKTLKVRIKVGSDSNLAQNNAAIYSGLGLDISPSSSFEDSPDGSGGMSPEFQDLPDESPNTIVQVMTCIAVPGGSLVSPLQDSLLQLAEKDSSFIKKGKRGAFYKGMPETSSDFADYTTHSREVKDLMEKQTKSREQKGRPREIRNSEGKDDVILSREIGIETQGGQEFASNSLNMPPSSISKNADKKTERHIVGNIAKNDTRMLDHSREMKIALLKDRSTFPGSEKDKPYELIDSTINNSVGSSGNEIMHSRGQVNSKASLLEKALEERNTNNQKDEKSELQREVRSKVEKDFDITNTHSSGHKRRNEQIAEPADHIKSSSSPCKERTLEGKYQILDRKKKLKISQTNSKTSGKFSKDNVNGSSSATLKEKKKISHAKTDHAEKKSKVPKSHKDLSGASFTQSHGNVNWDVKSEQLENGGGALDFHSKVKRKAMKPKHEKESIVTNQTCKESSGGKKVENTPISGAFVNEPILAPLICNVPATDATVAPQAPVVIEENWVCCDMCQKWRLLPYGTNPGHLPTKWQCNLLHWLPGMNSCDISEEETTNALHALYLTPAPGNGSTLVDRHDVAASSASLDGGVHLGQNLESNTHIGKKKSVLKDASNIPNHSTPSHFPNTVKKDQQAFVKCKSSSDANQNHPWEINSMNKGSLINASRSTDLNAEKQKTKQKIKHKSLGFFSDGGDHNGKSEKHSKVKSKREGDQCNVRESKKPKKEILQYPNKDCSNHDLAVKSFEETDIGGYSTNVIASNQSKWNNLPLSKNLKCDLRGNSSVLSKKLKDEIQFITNGESKEHFNASDVDKLSNLDVSAKKRKVKEWQESQRNQEALVTSQHVVENGVLSKGALSETEPVKDKKAELSMFVGKGYKASKPNSRIDRKGNFTRTAFPASGEHLSDGTNEDTLYVVEKEHRSSQSQGNTASLREPDFHSSKRDIVYAQPPAAANSSSSKVSGSHKSRSNLQETKGSPVESVSSSPLRIPLIEKFSCKRISGRNVDATNAGSSVLGSPKRCSDSEVNGGSGHSRKGRKEIVFSLQQQSLESHRVADSRILDSFEGTFDYLEKEINHLSGGKSEERLRMRQNTCDEFSPADLGEHPYKGDIQDLDKVDRHQLQDGSSQRKSGKGSSGFKEKYRGCNSDLDKSKLRVSDSYNENNDLQSTKNGYSCKLEVSFGSSESEKGNFQEKDDKDCLRKKDLTSKWMTGRQDNSSTFTIQENMDAKSPVLSNQQRVSNSKLPVVGTRCVKPDFQVAPTFHNEKTLNHPYSDRFDFPELLSGLGRSQLKPTSGDKQETKSQGPHMVSSPLKASRRDVEVVDAGNADASNKQHKQSDIHNGLQHNNLRHATPNGPDTSSPIRKENHSAVLKEARDLKHTANRLKNEGLELESTGLYFEAALKFLHVAALMEPVNFDSAKQAEAAQMYSDTAKLCVFVAHEYEKVKDMAAAALAYKCVEVAYLKAAYCKNPNASKDRHELQAALQLLPPGESPSSSASDVDNLNNQAILGRNASAKGVSSPQVAGNHVIAARHHQQVMRLLHYTNDLNCALEATRKSQIAIAATRVRMEKDRMDGMSSVKKALDFNFHNVEGLLRLVRLSLESIGR